MRKDGPNVILCLCDQLRAFEVGCWGNSVVRTPNIDTLAETGVRFETACSNNPVCTAARSVLLSGQYSRTCTGMLGNAQEPIPERRRLKEPVIPELFRDVGYDTALIGKWHIEPEPELLGFDYTLYPYYSHRYTGQTYKDSNGKRYLIDGFSADFEMENLNRYIKEHRNHPFFLYYNISQPHMPVYDTPDHYKTMYSPDTVPIRDNAIIDGKLAFDENWFKIYLWDYLYYREHLPYTEKLPEAFDLRTLTALYYGMITWVDDQVGNLINALKLNGIQENTIIVFLSDHGDNLGSHHLFNKDVLYDESIRIPMIFHWPAALRPLTIDTQVASIVDVMPTLLSLTGIKIPDSVQGTDLSSILTGEAESVGENAAFIETSLWQIGVRTLTHLWGTKLIREQQNGFYQPEDEAHLFFNNVLDPFQMRNLVETGEEVEIGMELAGRVRAWNRETRWMGGE